MQEYEKDLCISQRQVKDEWSRGTVGHKEKIGNEMSEW